MTSTPERVRDLITRSKLTQRAFSERIGLDTSKLSKSLNGTRRFTSLDLARIAELCHVTVDWLINGVEPEAAIAARSSGGSAAIAVEEADRLSEHRTNMAFLGFRQPWQPVASNSILDNLHYEATFLAELARSRVREAGLYETAKNLAPTIESAFGIDVAIVALGENFDGLAVSSDEVKLILVATSQVPPRQRFTLAHELGHILAGDDQRLHLDQDVYATPAKRYATERRANVFAAAFLLPEENLRVAAISGVTEGSFAELACDLFIPPAALANRLHELKLIDDEAYDRYKHMGSAEAASRAGRADDYARWLSETSASRPPGLLVKDAYRAYESGAATLRPYAALIGVDAGRLREALETDGQVITSS